MLKIIVATALTVALTVPAAAQNADFLSMVNETGCSSKFSDDKKADIYASRYKGKTMTVTGEVSTSKDGSVGVKVLRATLTHDVDVKLRNSRDAYDLEKGQRVTVTFNVSYHGGCFLSYSGENGVIGNASASR
jgi:ribosomal protein L21E